MGWWNSDRGSVRQLRDSSRSALIRFRSAEAGSSVGPESTRRPSKGTYSPPAQ